MEISSVPSRKRANELSAVNPSSTRAVLKFWMKPRGFLCAAFETILNGEMSAGVGRKDSNNHMHSSGSMSINEGFEG